MHYMANRLGAWQASDDAKKGKVEFKIFFPDAVDPEIASIQVAGDFQRKISDVPNWDFEDGFHLVQFPHAEGTIWTYRTEQDLPSGFYQYKYLVTFTDGTTRKVSDPCARYGGVDNQNAGFVIGGSTAAQNRVAPLRSGRKHLRDCVVYELMIDDFTDEYRQEKSPLEAVIDKLDYLKNLGFNAILFMPWTAWKNREFDWGYEPFMYFAVEYRYANKTGKPAEKISLLKKLVSACHDRDIHVIMDGVFNHVSVDFPYKHLYRDPERCPYTGIFGGSFPGLQDLDFNHTCTNEFIRDVCFYWMDNFGIDGIRFDNTVNFHVAGDPKGLDLLMEEIGQHVIDRGERNFSLTLEHIAADAVAVTNSTHATSYWDNALYEATFDGLWNNRIGPKLLNALNNQRFCADQEKVPTIYLSNHDHSHVAWQAGAVSNRGGLEWYKTQPYTIALFTAPATPMVQNGQEFAEDHWIMENDEGTGRRVIPRPLRWKLSGDQAGRSLQNLYKRLAEIRQTFTGLRSTNFYPQCQEEWQTLFNPQGYGIDSARGLAIYHRWGNDENGVLQRFIIVLNFSGAPRDVRVPFPENGEWTDLLSGYAGTWKPRVNDWHLNLTVGAYWGHLFFR